jgi:hypothetical protein
MLSYIRRLGASMLYSRRTNSVQDACWDKINSHCHFSDVAADLEETQCTPPLFVYRDSKYYFPTYESNRKIDLVVGASRDFLRMMAVTTQLCALSQYYPNSNWDSAKDAAYAIVKDLKQVMPDHEQALVRSRAREVFIRVAETYRESLCIYLLCRGLK